MKPSPTDTETHSGHRPSSRGTSPRQQRHKRLLTRARKNPRSALRDRRCLREPFLGDFFRLCHGRILEAPPVRPSSGRSCDALDFARVAIELAEKTGDRCYIHRAHGIHVHALIDGRRCHQAAEVLEDYRLSALACCPSCASDWHLRHADVSLEGFIPGHAGPALDLSLDNLGPGATADQRARRCFLRAILHHFQRSPGGALDDAGVVLRDLDLTSPRAYFLDTLAFIAVFLQRSRDPGHDSRALALLDEFRQRLRGASGFTAVRTRLAWVEGEIRARRRDWRRAHDCLAKAQKDLARTAPPKHLLAAGLDRCQLYAQRPNDASRREVLRTLGYYKTALDLEPGLKKGLEKTIRVVSSTPRYMLEALTRLRLSFIVPVPGIVVPFESLPPRTRRRRRGTGESK